MTNDPTVTMTSDTDDRRDDSVAARHRSRRRRAILTITAVLMVIIVGLLVWARTSRGLSAGELLAVQQGHVVFEHPQTITGIAVADRPAWLPGDASDITVKKPGPRADPGEEVKLDMIVGNDFGLPEECRSATDRAQPFDGGGRWPESAYEVARSCPAGWRATLVAQHLYVWR